MTSKNFIRRERCFLCGSEKALETIFSYPYTREGLSAVIKERYPAIAEQDLDAVTFEMVYCRTCDFFFQRYIPTDEFYWKYIYQGDNVRTVSTRQRTNALYYRGKAREVERISVFLSKLPHEIHVLEFGSGFGHWLLLAKAYGHNVCGIEIKKERVEASRANGLLVFSDLSELPPGQEFDFIFSEAVFEHVSEPVPYVEKLSKLLKPGGILVISIPYGSKEKTNKLLIRTYRGNDKIPKIIDPLEHINVFTNQSIRKLGVHAGLQPLSVIYAWKRFLQGITKTHNLHYLQEMIKFAYWQKFGNTVYFRKTNLK